MLSDNLIDKRLYELEESKSDSKYWNITREQGEFLSSLVSFKKPKNILEIGTSNGYSTLFLARELGEARIFTVEIDDIRFNEAKGNFSLCELNDKIRCLRGDVFCILNDNKFGCTFDLVFVDAAQKQYREIVEMLGEKNLLSENFVMVFDNISSHNYMDKFVEFMKQKYLCERIELGSGMLVCRNFRD